MIKFIELIKLFVNKNRTVQETIKSIDVNQKDFCLLVKKNK